MNFNHLEYAAAVAKYGSISKASQELLVSQPYLSGMIKSLEEEVGYQIFRRDRVGVTLTEQGIQFLSSAKTILQELEQIKSYKYDPRDIPLKMASYYSSSVMNRFLQFRLDYPNHQNDRLKEMGNKEVMEVIASGEYNLGFIFYAVIKEEKYLKMLKEYNLKSRPLFLTIPLYVIMSKKHPAASTKEFTLDMLLESPYVTYEDSSSIQYLQFIGLEKHPSLLAVSNRAGFYDALRSGKYLSVMALFEQQKLDEFSYIPISESSYFLNSMCIMRQNYKLSAHEKNFLEYLVGQ